MSDRWDPDVVERLARAVIGDEEEPVEYEEALWALCDYHDDAPMMLAHAREVRALREMESKVRDDVFLSRFFRDELAALDAAREGEG